MKDHAVMVIRRENKFLFAKRSENKKVLPGRWAFPTGTKEQGETPHQTAEREAFEELGVQVSAKETFFTKEIPEFNARIHFVECSLESGEPSIKEPEEITDLQWHTFEEFFAKHTDEEIARGLMYLRKNPQLWPTK